MTSILANNRHISNTRTEWTDVTKSNPCPICDKDHWCSTSGDRNRLVVNCREVDIAHAGAFLVKTDTNGNLCHFYEILDGIGPSGGYVHTGHLNRRSKKRKDSSKKPSKHWQRIASRCETETVRVADLARDLGVTTKAFVSLRVGYSDDGKDLQGTPCWTFPEKYADGSISGIKRRLVTPDAKGNTKKNAYLSTEGIYFADDWHTKPGPTFIPEGGSDTAAFISMGLSVIGRSGLGLSEELLKLMSVHPERQYIIVGENDRRVKDGKEQWPGRTGAINAANRGADKLDRSISWTLPPDDTKDSRTWLNKQKPDLNDNDGLLTLGGSYQAALEAEANEVHPPKRTKVEEYKPDTREVVSLSYWRKKMLKARIESLGKPGIYFDGSPTGSGKTYADTEPMLVAGKSLVVLPAHYNCNELVVELLERKDECGRKLFAPGSVAAYPSFDESTCSNFDEANKALSIGLPVASVVCPGCPHKNGCEYKLRLEAAKAAPHSIATRSRASLCFSSIAEGKKYVVVHEECKDLLIPMKVADPDAFIPIVELIDDCLFWENTQGMKTNLDGEMVSFMQVMREVAEHVNAVANTTETTKIMERRTGGSKPMNLDKRLWRAFKTPGRNGSTVKVNADALRIVTGIADGTIEHWAIDVGRPKGTDGVEQVVKSVVGVWKTEFPEDTPTWFADATGSASLIEKYTGKDVTDCTPLGRLELKNSVVQIPHDV
ncbi:MAG: hypothetical protein JKX85_15330, partial [Phycisphaeraceae bacterium]|nr:hypothetical protein [Phycisphaeraceae bacterium]